MLSTNHFVKRLSITFICIWFLFPSVVYPADWKKVGELPESPKFGRTEYFVDVDSIKKEGDVTKVWLKSVFSKPQPYEESKTFTNYLSLNYFNCSNKTLAVTQIDAYSSEGKLVGSEKQDIKYFPISEGGSDDQIFKLVCGSK